MLCIESGLWYVDDIGRISDRNSIGDVFSAVVQVPPLTWMPDNRLVFGVGRATGGGGDLFMVPAEGGDAQDLFDGP